MNEDHTRFLTVPEFGKEIKKSNRAVYNGIKNGDYPAVKVGQTLRIPAAYLDQLEDEANRSVTSR